MFSFSVYADILMITMVYFAQYKTNRKIVNNEYLLIYFVFFLQQPFENVQSSFNTRKTRQIWFTVKTWL